MKIKQLVLLPSETKNRLKTLRINLGISQQHVMREGIEIALKKYERLLDKSEKKEE